MRSQYGEDETSYFMRSDRAEMFEALVGEEFGGANLAHEPPVRARLRKDNGATSIADMGSRHVLRAACKHFVKGMEDVCGHGGRGNDENRHSAEA